MTSNQSLVWISVISGSLGIIAIFWLGKTLFNQQVGVLAALLTLTSPLHWFYSEVALNYSLEFLLVTACALLCCLLFEGHRHLWWGTAIAERELGDYLPGDSNFLSLVFSTR
jgi:uncharacterized membrane protein